MFVVQLHYKLPMEEVEKFVLAHRQFLDVGYQKNYLIASGPKNPRTGGVILSQLQNRAQLEDFLSKDPFFVHGVADFEITEFLPVKFHPDFKCFCE
jgi:uncharacterized protein YciI